METVMTDLFYICPVFRIPFPDSSVRAIIKKPGGVSAVRLVDSTFNII